MRCWNHGVSASAALPSRFFTGDEESCKVTDAQAESMAILGGTFHADGRGQPELGLESIIGASGGKR